MSATAALAALAARTHVALLHHPVLDKEGQTVTTAVTNLDIHDIARASRTFGLAGYFVVTPIAAQRELVAQIVGHWTHGAGRAHNDKRTDALEMVRIVASLDDAVAALGAPALVATGARPRATVSGYAALRRARIEDPRDMLIVFGTGWGLAESVFERADAVLAPIRGPDPNDDYNHLSVRSAVAIVLDRLFGAPESSGPH
jgi:hypothetical protein